MTRRIAVNIIGRCKCERCQWLPGANCPNNENNLKVQQKFLRRLKRCAVFLGLQLSSSIRDTTAAFFYFFNWELSLPNIHCIKSVMLFSFKINWMLNVCLNYYNCTLLRLAGCVAPLQWKQLLIYMCIHIYTEICIYSYIYNINSISDFNLDWWTNHLTSQDVVAIVTVLMPLFKQHLHNKAHKQEALWRKMHMDFMWPCVIILIETFIAFAHDSNWSIWLLADNLENKV